MSPSNYFDDYFRCVPEVSAEASNGRTFKKRSHLFYPPHARLTPFLAMASSRSRRGRASEHKLPSLVAVPNC
ncbi:UNVERIFIED_CONTAM: hypothetical protein HHA_450430 [Hammondia hammondi]|eukprot:XP_008889408.1 hypothetical protein HHA_450430 [Hammondia hammondi]